MSQSRSSEVKRYSDSEKVMGSLEALIRRRKADVTTLLASGQNATATAGQLTELNDEAFTRLEEVLDNAQTTTQVYVREDPKAPSDVREELHEPVDGNSR